MHRTAFVATSHLSHCPYTKIADLSVRRGGAQAWTYNYSTGPNQDWHKAREWCQKYFTDMVAIRNQEESDFLNNLLPFNPQYYWIGIQRVAGLWIWVDTSQNIPEEVQNWATAEPDKIPHQDCVEIYIKRAIDTTRWNNEKCHKEKGTICYTGEMIYFILMETFESKS